MIEVKKWLGPGALREKDKGIPKQLYDLKEFIERPLILVGFRINKKEQADEIKEESSAKTFLFSTKTHRGKDPRYPDYVDPDEWLLPGELESLVNELKSIFT